MLSLHTVSYGSTQEINKTSGKVGKCVQDAFYNSKYTQLKIWLQQTCNKVWFKVNSNLRNTAMFAIHFSQIMSMQILKKSFKDEFSVFYLTRIHTS